MIRSCWDYHLRIDSFEAWTHRLEARGRPVWNPPEVLRWNARKTYLRELAGAGIPTVPTHFLDVGEPLELDVVLEGAGWTDGVVKPVVSASAYETWRARRGDPDHAERFRRLAGRMPLIVQPYLAEIEVEGEWSFCFFGGTYSHALVKRPRPGDFRVQSDHGGVYRRVEAARDLVDQASAALRAAGRQTLYARVDGCVLDDRLVLMELELLEPGLFLALDPAAAPRFAGAIADALGTEPQE